MDLALLLLLLFMEGCVSGFNIDTSNPIIYEDVARNTSQRATYFGYTVLLNKVHSRVLIGAPRSNSTYLSEDGVIEPGVVYACPYLGQCKEIKMDSNGNEIPASLGVSNNIWDLKDYAWIGGAMDLERKKGGRLVVCGPRWKNQFYKATHKEYYMTGLCYSMFNELIDKPATRLTPTTSEKHLLFSPPWSTANVYFYAMSQAGMSVHLMPDNEDIGMILGAPGLLNWRGGIVEYRNSKIYNPEGRNKRSTDDRKDFAKKPQIVNPFYSTGPVDFNYFGYQVTSGHFFSRRHYYYAASSPRGSSFKGHVLIIDFPREVSYNTRWNYYDMKLGLEFGEYFGYSLTAGDITGDGYDDLVVGAPFYSNKGKQPEIGRIHVFLGSHLYSLQTPVVGDLIEGMENGGRFGLAVVALGDIDQDGYHDVAVGAPYEDNGRGVVYIFNGSPLGLKPQYSQRIAAADVDLSLRGFGVSISPPDDMDGNRYDDVAVGAFMSGHAVLFRTHPVVKLFLSVKPSVNLLRNETSSFDVMICHSYDGSNPPESINVTYSAKVDEKYGRAVYDGREREVTLLAATTSCRDLKVQLNSSEESLEDVKIHVRQDVVKKIEKRSAIWIKPKSARSGEDTFCKSCPILEKLESVREVSLSLQYARDCDPCYSDLHLSSDLLDISKLTSLEGVYILGSGKDIRLVVNVTNKGDVSYGSFLTVKLPENVNIANRPNFCREVRDGSLLSIVCDFKGPLRKGVVKPMVLDLEMSYVAQSVDEVTGRAPDIVFQVEVMSNSIEEQPRDNAANLTLRVETEADLYVFGQSREELYSYIKKDEEEAGPLKILFNQIYRVFKVGRSPVQEMEVKFSLPKVWSSDNIDFLSIYQPQGQLYNQPVNCRGVDVKFVQRRVNIQSDDTSIGMDEQGRSKRSLEDEKSSRISSKVHEYPANRSLYLNCSTPEVQCVSVSCVVTQFELPSLELRLTLELDVKSLEPLMKDKDIIHVSTEADVKIKKPVAMVHSDKIGPDHVVVSSTFVGTLQEKRVALWIIVLSAVAGILLLGLLILGLVKAGFFRRKKKEELEALKSADDDFEAYQGSVNLVNPPVEKDTD